MCPIIYYHRKMFFINTHTRKKELKKEKEKTGLEDWNMYLILYLKSFPYVFSKYVFGKFGHFK